MKQRIQLIKLITKDVEFWLKLYDKKRFNHLQLKQHFYRSSENVKCDDEMVF